MDTTNAYAAGLFDGEGSVKLHTHKVGGKAYYHVRVSVTNTERTLLTFLKTEYGGHVGGTGMEAVAGKQKKCWRWEASCRVAVAFLDKILPFMREPEKIRRTNLALQFATTTPAERLGILTEFHKGSRVKLRSKR